jgi:phage terminase large subunit-like protein
MLTMDMQEYVKNLGGQSDQELQKLTEQIGRNGKTDLSDSLLAAVLAEILARKNSGVQFNGGSLYHRV